MASARSTSSGRTRRRWPRCWSGWGRVRLGEARERRERRRAARFAVRVAGVCGWFEPSGAGKRKGAVDRSLLVWAAMPEALTFSERLAERTGGFAGGAATFERL